MLIALLLHSSIHSNPNQPLLRVFCS